MKNAFRWIGMVLGGVVALALVVVGVLYAVSGRKLSATHAVSDEQPLAIPTDSAGIARGAHLVGALGCGQCHGDDLGGRVFADAGPFALLAGPNLTRGQGGRNPVLTVEEWERAIRHGIRREGTGMIVMPSEAFHALSDADLGPMIGYLTQLPPVDRDVPAARLRIIGRALLGAGTFQLATALLPSSPHVAAVDTALGPAYGKYLTDIAACRVCHGPSLSGGPNPEPGGVPVSNLTPTGIGHYTEADFLTAMRTGARPGGATLNEQMPWRAIGTMTDSELRSIWRYLQTLPAKAFGTE